MRTIDAHPVRFGELAGPLLDGARFFDWQLVSTQEVATAVGHPFEEIVADEGIPYAPVGLETSVERYPTFEDTVSVETVPRAVGETSVELVYEVVDDGGTVLSTGRMTHVTIAPAGGALALPGPVRDRLANERVDRDPNVGPSDAVEPGDDGPGADDPDALPTFASTFPIHAPHVEGSQLAYFEEYPRFGAIALEEFLDECGTTLGELAGPTQPFRLRDWRWEFTSPVPFESELRVQCDVRAVTEETVRVEHTLRTDEGVKIEGVTDYGCFDRSGRPVAFDDAALAPFRE